MREKKFHGRFVVAGLVFLCGLPVMVVLAAGSIVTRLIMLLVAAGRAIVKPFGGSRKGTGDD